MITLGWIVFVALLIGYFTCVIWAVVLDMDILTEVNARLPQDKQFPLIGRSRTWELWKQYKSSFRKAHYSVGVAGFLPLPSFAYSAQSPPSPGFTYRFASEVD
jgi:hypothetical protein